MSKSIRTLIVDDEPLGRRMLRGLLSAHDDFQVVAECKSGPEAIRALSQHTIDLVFLDVQMPEMTGFEMLEHVAAEKLPVIIFVTGFDQYAVRAFEVAAFDYLLKPVDPDRFTAALARARKLLKARADPGLEERLQELLSAVRMGHTGDADEPQYLRRLLIKTASRVLVLPVEDIDYIRAYDYYSCAFTHGKNHLLRKPMKELENELDPRRFLRIHRSTIVNVGRVKELRQTADGCSLTLHDGTSLAVSRGRWRAVQARLQ